MKKSMFATVMFVCLSASLFAEVGWPDLKEARKLRDNGKYEEALKKHIWFHEASKKQSSGSGGVRLSYALEDWIKLSKKYPPAKKALIAIRDKDEKALLDGTGDFQNFHDLSSINEYLKQEDKTYKLFLIIDKKYPELASYCFIVAKDLLEKHKDYQICGKYIKDPIGEYEKIRSGRELNLSLMRTDPKLNDSKMQEFTDDTFINDTCQLIEILIGLNRKKEAEEIQKRALKYFDNEKIKTAITDAEKKIKS